MRSCPANAVTPTEAANMTIALGLGSDGEWTVVGAGAPEGVEKDSEPPGQGNDDGIVFGGAAVQLGLGPAAQVGIWCTVAECEVGGFDEERAQVRVALLGDGEPRVTQAGLAATRNEAEIGTDITAAAEAGGVSQGEDERQGGNGAHPWDLLEQASVWEGGIDDALEVAVHLGDALGEEGDRLDARAEGGAQLGGKRDESLAMEVAGIAGRQAQTERLGGATAVIDERGAGADKSEAGADEGQGYLCLQGAMVDRGQEVWVGPAQACESHGINAVRLTRTGGNELEPARVGDDHLMAERGDEAGDPGRLGPCLEDNTGGGQLREAGSQPFEGRRDLVLLDERASGIDGS